MKQAKGFSVNETTELDDKEIQAWSQTRFIC